MSESPHNIPKLADFVTFTRPRPGRFELYSFCFEMLYWILLSSFLVVTFAIVLHDGLLGLLSLYYVAFFALVEMVGRRRKRYRVNARKLLSETSKMPTLYLRSFYYERSDMQSVIKQADGKEGWYEKENDDEVLALALRNVSQLIAVGSHNDKLPPLGAVRLYFKDDEWQGKIRELISIAQIIIIQPGYTNGTDWEINALKEMNVPPEKIIFCFIAWHHLKRRERQSNYEDFAMQIKRIYGLELPKNIKNSYFLYLDKNWQPHLVGLKGWKAIFFWLSSRQSIIWSLLNFRVDSPSFMGLSKYIYWFHYLLQRLPIPRIFRRFSIPSVREAIRPILEQQGIKLPVWRTASYVVAWLGIVVFASLSIRGGAIKLIVTPADLKTKSMEVNIHDSILESPLVEYKGKQVPYTIQLRRAWSQKSLTKDEIYDYWFKIIDLEAHLYIFSSRERDISSLESFPDMRLEVLRQALNLEGDKIKLVDSSPLLINGQTWMSSHIEIILENKATVDEYSRAYLGNEGTIYLVGLVANKDAFSLKLLEESLNSIKIDNRDESKREGRARGPASKGR